MGLGPRGQNGLRDDDDDDDINGTWTGAFDFDGLLGESDVVCGVYEK